MLRSILLDIAVLGIGGALLISAIDVQGALVSLAIGAIVAITHSVTNESTNQKEKEDHGTSSRAAGAE